MFQIAMILTCVQFGTPTSTPPTSGTVQCVAAADFDGDGVVEVAIARDTPNGIELFENNGAGALSSAANVAAPAGASAAGFMTTADVDGDGDLDLLVTYTGGTDGVAVYRNTTPGGGPISFAADALYASTNTDPGRLAAADFNGDGDVDVALGSLDSGVEPDVCVLLNNGTGAPPFFGAGSNVTFPGGTVTSMGIAAADLDSDGDIDLAVTGLDPMFTNPSGVAIFANDGAAVFTATAGSPVSSGGGFGFLIEAAIADYGGGGLDVAAMGVDNAAFLFRVDTFLNGGGMSFAASAAGPFGPGDTAGSFRSALRAVDINQDGFMDVVGTMTALGGVIRTFVGNGTGNFPATASNPVPIAGTSVLQDLDDADFNGDGRADVVAVDSGTNMIAVYLNVNTLPTPKVGGGNTRGGGGAKGWLPCTAGADALGFSPLWLALSAILLLRVRRV